VRDRHLKFHEDRDNLSPVAREALWRETFGQIRKGMTVDDVTALVGQPTEIRGDEATVLVYRPAPGVEIHVQTAPKVVAVQQIMDGRHWNWFE
jgi:hypothetical protein